MGVLNLMLKVSGLSGEKIPLSKPPTLPVKVLRGVSGRMRELEAWVLDELADGPVLELAEEAGGVCEVAGSDSLELGGVECVWPRLGVTKLV